MMLYEVLSVNYVPTWHDDAEEFNIVRSLINRRELLEFTLYFYNYVISTTHMKLARHARAQKTFVL